MAIKKLTILHSNDLHGDFLPKTTEDGETGGLVRLSGYVNKVRSEQANTVYLSLPEGDTLLHVRERRYGPWDTGTRRRSFRRVS